MLTKIMWNFVNEMKRKVKEKTRAFNGSFTLDEFIAYVEAPRLFSAHLSL